MDRYKIVPNILDDPNGFEVFAHQPTKRPKATIINIPGYRSDIDGYNHKYVKIGDDLATRGFQFVRMPNIERPPGRQYAKGLLGDLRAVVEFFSRDVGGRHEPLYLMGFSAGGFAAAVVGAENPNVEKILLMEPSASESLVGKLPRSALGRYEGEVYIVLGDHDGVGSSVGWLYHDSFAKASPRKLTVIDNCGHQFTGKTNGQIMAKAPLWAFAGDKTFPSPEGGLVLY
jgi:dienelactone hydrolase